VSPWFEFPKNAYFGRVLPKNKIYAYAGASTKLKELFVRQVEQIVWKYKLAPETINISATDAVSEIQVFGVALKTGELKHDVLRAMDKAIPFPIFYELSYGGRVKVIASYKRPNESASEKWVAGSYFWTDWLPGDEPRQALPVALNLTSLYEAMLRSLIPYVPRDGETLQAQVERAELIRAKVMDLARLEDSLRSEKQFNRKVEINSKIRTIRKMIETLIGG
jgi:hypothetical protein